MTTDFTDKSHSQSGDMLSRILKICNFHVIIKSASKVKSLALVI